MTAPDTSDPRPALDGWSTASAMHARVVGAVIMRDLQTRFGTGYLGFLLGLIMPLGHLTIAMVIMTTLGRLAPIGTNIPTFSMTGVLPFVLWLYGHRQIMIAFQQNRPLLYFPGVDISDLLSARIIIEVASGTLVVVMVLLALALIGYDITPGHLAGFVYGLMLAWLLGIATGLIFGNVGAMWPAFLMFGNLLGPLFWITSGIVYLPDALPDKLKDILVYFPLCQIVDFVRSSFFSEYESTFFVPKILYAMMLILIMIGMTFIPILRKVT